MQITLNGKPREVDAGTTLDTLLGQLRLDITQVVVEHNRQIVPRQRLGDVILTDGDTLEVVNFVGGG